MFVGLENVEQRSGRHIDLQRLLLQREKAWIFKLKIMTPRGLNMDIDYSVFL